LLRMYPSLDQALGEGRNGTIILYPGKDAVDLDKMLMPSPESPESRQSVETLLVLDGTWHETKELLRRIPQLSNLPKAALPINLAAKADGRSLR